jgi:hypothetical protein
MLWSHHDNDLPATCAEVQMTIAGIPAGVEEVLLKHYRIYSYNRHEPSAADSIANAIKMVTGWRRS